MRLLDFLLSLRSPPRPSHAVHVALFIALSALSLVSPPVPPAGRVVSLQVLEAADAMTMVRLPGASLLSNRGPKGLCPGANASSRIRQAKCDASNAAKEGPSVAVVVGDPPPPALQGVLVIGLLQLVGI